MAKKKLEKKTETPKKTTKTVKAAVAAAPAKVVDTYKVLRAWNMRLAVVFALEAIAVAVLGSSKSVPMVLHYPAIDTLATEANKHDVFAVASRHLFDVRIAFVVAAFLLILAVFHALVATRCRASYEAGIAKGVNTARWIAFGLSGATMVIAISLLSGMSDVVTLKFAALGVLFACLCVLAVELLGPGRPGLRKLLAVLAIVSGTLPWLALGVTAGAAALLGEQLPMYVYAVCLSTLLLFAAVGLATAFRWAGKGKWVDTLYSEKMYMFLGFATATALAAQIFAGALLP